MATLALQVAVVCAAARALGWSFERLGQPRVVGEILAGVLLGPSLLGWAAPAAAGWLFPKSGLGPLGTLSQLGLLFFMFQIGLELDLRQIRQERKAVLRTAGVGILVPFAAGAGLAVVLYPQLSTAGVPEWIFALFLGTAMSVTAFPVLARILGERGLLRTRVGSVALAAAAANDVVAWCLLAVLVATVRAGAVAPLAVGLAGVIIYVCGMFLLGAGLRRGFRTRPSTARLVGPALVLLFLSAGVTETLGIHALFGAFLAGAVLPRDGMLGAELRRLLEPATTLVLLPLFFASAGLRTDVRLLDAGWLWWCCALIIVVASAGKILSSALAARSAGLDGREALQVGALMNARGLVELVVLSVGLELGVLSSTLFSMMVLMALCTTLMTAPLLELLRRRGEVADGAVKEREEPALGWSGPGRRRRSWIPPRGRSVPAGAARPDRLLAGDPAEPHDPRAPGRSGGP